MHRNTTTIKLKIATIKSRTFANKIAALRSVIWIFGALDRIRIAIYIPELISQATKSPNDPTVLLKPEPA